MPVCGAGGVGIAGAEDIAGEFPPASEGSGAGNTPRTWTLWWWRRFSSSFFSSTGASIPPGTVGSLVSGKTWGVMNKNSHQLNDTVFT